MPRLVLWALVRYAMVPRDVGKRQIHLTIELARWGRLEDVIIARRPVGA